MWNGILLFAQLLFNHHARLSQASKVVNTLHTMSQPWENLLQAYKVGTRLLLMFSCTDILLISYVPSSMICPIAVLGLQTFILFFPAEFCVSSWIVKISVPSYTLSLIICIVKFAVVFLWSNLTLLSVFTKSLPPARH